MSKKRNATSELNHDNWDSEEPDHDVGEYKKASSEELKGRVIKTARRRIQRPTDESDAPPTKSVFSNIKFTATPSAATPNFSFLSKIPPTNGSSTSSPKKDETTTSTSSVAVIGGGEKKSAEYISKLKDLNKTVASWIKLKVDANASCILTPIFKDYEMYLKKIEEEGASVSVAAPISKTFSFSTSNAEMKAAEMSSIEAKPAAKSSVTSAPFTQSGPSVFAGITKTASSPTSGAKPFSTGSSPFTSGLSTNTPISFGFGSQPSAAPTGFSFSSGNKPFTFGNVAPPPADETKKVDEEENEDEPPKVEFTPIEEEGSFYSKRCKFFVKTKDAFDSRGIGTLHLKPVEDSDKTQMIIRADNSLGTILLNIILAEAIPTKLMGANNVMMVCNPTPQDTSPVSVLIRVKTGEEAKELLETIVKYKK